MSRCEPEVFMIDNHCHLADAKFREDLDDVLEKAKQVGVRGLVVVPEFAIDFKPVLEIADRYPNLILPCLGLHPVQETDEPGKCRSVNLKEFEEVRPYIEENIERIGAIGEVGLDFTPYYLANGAEDKETQREVFRRQIDIAKKHDLPLNVHSRSAGRPTIALLKEQGADKVLLHAFSGKASVAMEGVKEGYYFSIPPCSVNSEQKQKMIKAVPIDNLMLETDSPVLGPQKGERNVPENVTVSCEVIAKIKNMDIDEVKRITTRNALRLFPRLHRFIKV